MTIQEAMKTGKPFKRKLFTSYIIIVNDEEENEEPRFRSEKGYPIEIWPIAILADDWEVKND